MKYSTTPTNSARNSRVLENALLSTIKSVWQELSCSGAAAPCLDCNFKKFATSFSGAHIELAPSGVSCIYGMKKFAQLIKPHAGEVLPLPAFLGTR
jgi:hypothetical protein